VYDRSRRGIPLRARKRPLKRPFAAPAIGALPLVASSDETPSYIKDNVSGNCGISERWVGLVYDRSGAFEGDIQHVYVDLFCVKHAVVFAEILDSKLHGPNGRGLAL
jgi:hypothetical protein